MKKRLVTIFSLIMAFVLCFTLVACGGGDDKSKDKKPPQSDNTVSISVNDAINALNGVMNAKGFTGTASYTLSTKNTEKLTESVALDKRGTKLKMASGDEEMIVDLQTGYVYYKHGDYYSYSNEFYANAFDYAQYLLASLKQEDDAQKIDAVYDKQAKTVTFTVEKADGVNKYLEPLQNAYKKDKSIGDLLNEYCKLLSGKTFDAMYSEFENYVKNPKNTVGTLLNSLKEAGLDVEAMLEMFGYTLPKEQMTAIKARPLNKLIVGAYNFIMQNLGDLMTLDENDDDDDISSSEGGGMESFGMGLLDAMLNAEVSEQEIAVGLQGIGGLVAAVKEFKAKTIIDSALAGNQQTADLYTIVREGVKLTDATVTLTLTVGDNKTINGVKVESFAAHNYKGEAAEGSLLADNDYRATAEIVIDEYKTSTEDFVITCNPAMEYKTSLVAYMYEVSDKNVSVYLETGGKPVTINRYVLEWETPDGDIREIQPEDANTFKFDQATSSFVFDSGLIRDAFSDAALNSYIQAGYSAFGTMLTAYVYFDGDDTTGYGITLAYVNDDWQAISDYLYQNVMENIMDFIGGAGSDAPDIGEVSTLDGKYCYVTPDDEIDMENNYFIINNGEIVECFIHGEDLTDSAMLDVSDNEIEIFITFPATDESEEYSLLLCGTVHSGYINITSQYAVVDGELADSFECDDIYTKVPVED